MMVLSDIISAPIAGVNDSQVYITPSAKGMAITLNFETFFNKWLWII